MLLISGKLICGYGGIGSFRPSAAGGGRSEGRKGAAVKIERVNSEQTILGTARVTRNAAAVPQNKLICGYGGIGRRVRFRF